jgi:hypothetical protein
MRGRKENVHGKANDIGDRRGYKTQKAGATRLFRLGHLVLALAPAGIDIVAGHACAEDHVPVNEVGLAEVGLDANSLVIRTH